MSTNKATAPKSNGNEVYHLRLKEGDVPGYMIIPGAPERTLKIAQDWEDVKEVASYREYKTVTGTYKGAPIGTTSTGIGAASSEIAIHELNTIGVHTCIRVGTTGCIQPEFELGDLIIPYAAVRQDGTSQLYIEPEFPAAADTYVVMALIEACERLGYPYKLGIGYSTSSFYTGQGRPLNEDGTGYWPSHAEKLVSDLQQAGVSNIEMEAAGQYVVGHIHGMRMGSIMSVISNRVTNEWGDAGGEERSCRAASEAIKILQEWDETGEITLHAKMKRK